eukprot:TRINITY_DN28694_c0_g2_i1.p1 TRINITY_DN28694_c0_g2~~TRINITY_DN28694_c0_g2_i1.p1  ORF type:complete len:170 (-),score=32.18 TRINITY_DN28694_c0_g2_i1:127-636(-)
MTDTHSEILLLRDDLRFLTQRILVIESILNKVLSGVELLKESQGPPRLVTQEEFTGSFESNKKPVRKSIKEKQLSSLDETRHISERPRKAKSWLTSRLGGEEISKKASEDNSSTSEEIQITFVPNARMSGSDLISGEEKIIDDGMEALRGDESIELEPKHNSESNKGSM